MKNNFKRLLPGLLGLAAFAILVSAALLFLPRGVSAQRRGEAAASTIGTRIDGDITGRVPGRVVYQLRDEDIAEGFELSVNPITGLADRKRPAFIVYTYRDHSFVDLIVARRESEGGGWINVTRVPGNNGRSPGSWDTLQPADEY